jgi:transcriptional regulator
MHPDRAFEWSDRDEMLDFIARTAFAAIFIETASGPMLAHAPLLVESPDRLRFHLSRRNEAASVDGAPALISCMGSHAYVSPDWYGTDDQVPTWNYVMVECRGTLRRLADGALTALLDGLSAVQEAALAPKPQWTRDKMSAGRFDAMSKAIVPFELEIVSIRGTRKLGQNKSSGEIEGAAAALEARGDHQMATLMRSARR